MTRGIGYYTLVALLLLACVLLLLVGIRRNQRANTARTDAAQTSPSVTATTPVVRVRIGGQASATPRTAAPPPTSLSLPEDIRLSDVNEVSTIGGQTVLTFRDGSRLPVTPDVRDRLPGDLQLRLDYTRDH